MKDCNVIGLDIAKRWFEVCVQDPRGHVLMTRKLSRGNVLGWFSKQSHALVGLEACGGAHYWARALMEQGHEVKILPPQHVKPFVRTNKSDAQDAQAIGRALREPDIPPVPIADRGQQDVQVFHRVRERLVGERTALVNQMRGILLEYGIALPVGLGRARSGVRRLLEQPPAALSSDFLCVLQDLFSELLTKDERIERYTGQMERWVREDVAGIRVMKVPGIGVLSASALLVKLRHAGTYRNGRHFAARLGLVPRHEGSGGKVQMKGMSKRGDRYLRKLLIHGARAVIRHRAKRTDALGVWICNLVERRGMNKAAVALANKQARMVWRLMTQEEDYQPWKAAGRRTSPAVGIEEERQRVNA